MLSEKRLERLSEQAAVDASVGNSTTGQRELLNSLALLAWPMVFPDAGNMPDWTRLVDNLKRAVNFPHLEFGRAKFRLGRILDTVETVMPRPGEDITPSAMGAVISSIKGTVTAFEYESGVTLDKWAETWAEPQVQVFMQRWARGVIDGKERDLRWVKKNNHLFADPQVALLFQQEELRSAAKDQVAFKKTLKTLVAKLEGKDTGGALVLSTQRIARLDKLKKRGAKDKNQEKVLEAYARYKRLRGYVTKAYRQIVMEMVLDNGGQPVDMKKVQSRMKALKITDHSWPATFNGKLGVFRRPGSTSLSVEFYTRFDERLELRPSGDVRMNPKYKEGSSLQYCKYLPPNSQTGKYVTVQTVVGKNKADKEKFEKVDELLEVLDLKDLPWRKGLLNDSNPHQDVCACIELIFWTACRIGSETAARSGSFGATTLQRQHVERPREASGRIRKYNVRYFQKRNNHHYILDSKDSRYIKKVMMIMAENGRPRRGQKTDVEENRLFLSAQGRGSRGLAAREVNAALKAMGLPTAHKFRHARGTSVMARELEREELQLDARFSTPEEVDAAFWRAAEQVARELHHVVRKGEGGEAPNAITSIKSYITPELTRSFYRKYNVPLPNRIRRLLRDAE